MNGRSDSFIRSKRDGQRGQALVLMAFLLVVLLSAAALVIDIGDLYYSYQQLQSATSAAAMAGGSAIPDGDAVNIATEYSGDQLGGAIYNIHSNLNITGVTPTLGCIPTATYTTLGLPPCVVYGTQAAANAIQVTETAKVPTYFAKIFGVPFVNISATATATAKGGSANPFNIMMILDTTASMGTTTDPGCTVPGVRGNPTAEQCAQYGVQQLLGELDPCSIALTSCPGGTNGVINNPVDQVGLMVFPGLCSQALVAGACPTSTATSPTYAQGTGYADDYACPATNPVTTPYNNNPAYLILPLQSDYRTSDTAGLNSGTSGANIVKAVGAGVGTCSGVGTPGAQGTFYAGVIAQAQAYLTANSLPNVQNVIILLSDGDATASSTQLGGKVTNYSTTGECTQAVNAATAAKGTSNPDTPSLNTLIYSVSYGSESNVTCAGESGSSAYATPCATMAAIASTPTSQYFFSVPLTGKSGGTVCSGARDVTTLDDVFSDIAGDLTTSRRIPNGSYSGAF